VAPLTLLALSHQHLVGYFSSRRATRTTTSSAVCRHFPRAAGNGS